MVLNVSASQATITNNPVLVIGIIVIRIQRGLQIIRILRPGIV